MRFVTPWLITFFLLSCQSPASAAGVDGVVVENKSGKPLARARVTLESLNGALQPQPVYTSAQGTFRFENLAAGNYRLLAERTGFVPARFGQSQYDSGGTPIVLNSSGHFFAQLKLSRPPSVKGAVVDENGIGMPGFSVSAYRIGTRPRQVAVVITDDRGQYSFLNLGPGRYVFQTSARVLEDGRAVLPTFLGGTAAFSQARITSLALDEEAAGLDIAPVPGQLRTIRGHVNAPGVVAVQLLGDLGMQQATVDASGGFQFQAVPSGHYSLIASATPTSGPLSAFRSVDISDEDRQVTLELMPSPVVALRCQASQGSAPNSSLTLFFERDNYDDGAARRLDCGGSLTLPAGPWNVRLLPLSGHYVKAVQGLASPEGRSDVMQIALAGAARKELVTEVSAKAARVLGKVVAGRSQPIIGVAVGLAAVDADTHRRMGGARLGKTDAEGRFRFDGLAPGDYRIITKANLESAGAVDREIDSGNTLSLREGQELELEIEWKN